MTTRPKTDPQHKPVEPLPARLEQPSDSRPIPQRVENRPTEDDLAQQALGGPKGSPELPPAPLTKSEEEQTFPNDDPGHVA
jgi:hypothetical protein